MSEINEVDVNKVNDEPNDSNNENTIDDDANCIDENTIKFLSAITSFAIYNDNFAVAKVFINLAPYEVVDDILWSKWFYPRLKEEFKRYYGYFNMQARLNYNTQKRICADCLRANRFLRFAEKNGLLNDNYKNFLESVHKEVDDFLTRFSLSNDSYCSTSILLEEVSGSLFDSKYDEYQEVKERKSPNRYMRITKDGTIYLNKGEMNDTLENIVEFLAENALKSIGKLKFNAAKTIISLDEKRIRTAIKKSIQEKPRFAVQRFLYFITKPMRCLKKTLTV